MKNSIRDNYRFIVTPMILVSMIACGQDATFAGKRSSRGRPLTPVSGTGDALPASGSEDATAQQAATENAAESKDSNSTSSETKISVAPGASSTEEMDASVKEAAKAVIKDKGTQDTDSANVVVSPDAPVSPAPETVSPTPETVTQAPETVTQAPETVSPAPETVSPAPATTPVPSTTEPQPTVEASTNPAPPAPPANPLPPVPSTDPSPPAPSTNPPVGSDDASVPIATAENGSYGECLKKFSGAKRFIDLKLTGPHIQIKLTADTVLGISTTGPHARIDVDLEKGAAESIAGLCIISTGPDPVINVNVGTKLGGFYLKSTGPHLNTNVSVAAPASIGEIFVRSTGPKAHFAITGDGQYGCPNLLSSGPHPEFSWAKTCKK